ncbi:cupin domain-containing protein, partial [Chloroflexota bacterium]
MKVIKTNDIETEEITANTKSGKVTRQGITGEGDDKLTISVVNFSKGTVREYDDHKFDQILYIAQGEGIIKTEKEEVTVTPGTFVFIPAGEKHSHCSTEES